MLLKIFYVLVRRLLTLAVLMFRCDSAKDAELLVLGAENCVTSCDLGIFVNQAAEPVPPQNPAGFHNLVAPSDLQRCNWAGGGHAALSYSWISPPRALRRRILAVVRSVVVAMVMSSRSGSRRFRARCGRWRL